MILMFNLICAQINMKLAGRPTKLGNYFDNKGLQ